LAIAEINSLGFSCGYLDHNNIVKVGESDYRLFDLNYLTGHFKGITNVSMKTEKGPLAPEIQNAGQVYPKTDVWNLGHLLLKIYEPTGRSQLSIK
jgi:hypothetical protein